MTSVLSNSSSSSAPYIATSSSGQSLTNSGQYGAPVDISRKPPSYYAVVTQKAPEESVPEGWSRLYSDKHKRYYYVNTKTGKSVWTLAEIKEEIHAQPQAFTQNSQSPQTSQSPQSPQKPQQTYSPQYTSPYQSPQAQYVSPQPQQPYNAQTIQPYSQYYPQPSQYPSQQAQQYPLQQPLQYPQQYYQQSTSPQPYSFYSQQTSQYPTQQKPEWIEITQPDGRKYYQNNVTRKTQWEKPQAPYVPYVPPQTRQANQATGAQFWDM